MLTQEQVELIELAQSELETITCRQEDELFAAMSHEEKLKYSSIAEFRDGEGISRPTLNIYQQVWAYISELDQWVLIGRYHSLSASQSYSPSFVRLSKDEISYIFDCDTFRLYQEITQSSTTVEQ